jgi:hypothetical protein
MPRVVADLQSGRLQPIYQATHRPDVARTPAPRWDLINFRHYVTMSVQFSRGCPFDCEFCDIIVMNGRVPRTKTPAQLIAELDALARRGWKDMVFVVDDNFIGNKPRTKALLREMIEWRRRTRTRIGFLTEASMNLADDPELCALMVAAGFKKVLSALKRRPPSRWRNATSCRTGTVTWWTRCRHCNAPAWKSWVDLLSVSTATRRTSSSGSLNSSSAPAWRPRWWDC